MLLLEIHSSAGLIPLSRQTLAFRGGFLSKLLRLTTTRKCASPEIMEENKLPREDPPDAFSPGSVLHEIAMLLLGMNFEE